PAPVCGNGAVESGEDCDDGNTTSGDGCSATCRIESVSRFPGFSRPWHVPAPCITAWADGFVVAPVCGDCVIDPGEQCDDGNTTSGAGCSATCQIEVPPAVPARVADRVLAALRISGQTRVVPDAETQMATRRAGRDSVRGAIGLCITAEGGVSSTRVLM